MSTTQIIIAACSVLVSICLALVAYIFLDAKKIISNSVTEKNCNERRGTMNSAIQSTCTKLSKHRHTDDGKVEVEI